MEIIDKYIYAVTSRLPYVKREDIEKELRSILEDMMDSLGGQTKENAKKAVEELGDPAKLAEKYSDTPRYLISPRNFDTYSLILKIVLFAVTLGITIASIISFISVNTEPNVINSIGAFFGSLIPGLLNAFAIVTIIFWLVDKNQTNIEQKLGINKEWTSDCLAEVPQKKAAISRADCIGGIVGSTIFMLIFALVPFLIAAYIPNNGTVTVVEVFDLTVLNERIWMFFAVFAVGILSNVTKLITGRWTLQTAVVSAASTLVIMFLLLGIFADRTIWNANFASDISAFIGNDLFTQIWSIMTQAIVWIICIANVVSAGSDLYKGFVYGKR